MRCAGTHDPDAATEQGEREVLRAALAESRARHRGIGDGLTVLVLKAGGARRARGELSREFDERPDTRFPQVRKRFAATLTVHREHRLDGPPEQARVRYGGADVVVQLFTEGIDPQRPGAERGGEIHRGADTDLGGACREFHPTPNAEEATVGDAPLHADTVLRGPTHPDAGRAGSRFRDGNTQVQHAVTDGGERSEGVDQHQTKGFGPIQIALRVEDRAGSESITRADRDQSRHIGRVDAWVPLPQRLYLDLHGTDRYDTSGGKGQRERGTCGDGIDFDTTLRSRGARVARIP